MADERGEQLRWTTGSGGWFRFDHPELPGPLYVRLLPLKGARWFPVEVYLDGRPDDHSDERDAEIRPETLRLVASWLPQIERMVSGDGDLRAYLDEVVKVTPHGPDLSRLASHFGMGVRSGGKPGVDWIRDSRRAQQGELPQPPRAPDPVHPAGTDACPPPPAPAGELTDDFLRSVERFYSWQAAHGYRDAAQRTAAAAGVSARTVHSWLYRGRKRGVIATTRQGAR